VPSHRLNPGLSCRRKTRLPVTWRRKKGLMEKVRDWNSKQAEGSNCHLCTGTCGPRDRGAAKCAEASPTSENKRLLLPRGTVLRKK